MKGGSENVETTTTETERTSSDDGTLHETETVTREWNEASPHHCTCAECQEWEEDLAHEIATLRIRLGELIGDIEGEKESRVSVEGTETVVESTPEVEKEQKKEEGKEKEEEETNEEPAEKVRETPRKRERRGWFY